MLLAIDTSTEIASIALAEKGSLVVELTWRCGRNHTAELMPNLVRIFQQVKAASSALDGIAVAIGLGSFNGLRVGVSTAKGLGFALGLPLVGIGTLEIEAFPHAMVELPICPVHNAGRGEIATALYQKVAGEWRKIHEEYLTTVEALCSETRTKTLFCGELSASMETELRERLGELAIIPEEVTRLRRAGYLAQLGWRRLKMGEADDLATLQPLYLRHPPITQPKRKFLQSTLWREGSAA